MYHDEEQSINDHVYNNNIASKMVSVDMGKFKKGHQTVK